MTPTPPYKFVAVTWHDAWSPEATAIFDAKDLTEEHGPMSVVTCGWLIRDDDKAMMLASEWFVGTTDFRGTTCILKANVVEVQELGQKKPPRRRRPQVSETAP